MGINFAAAAQTGASVIKGACFFNPTDTGINANYFANQPRTSGILRNQGVENWGASPGKKISIHDSVNAEFRAEVFNIANRVQFADPGLQFGSVTFGTLTSTMPQRERNFQSSLRVN